MDILRKKTKIGQFCVNIACVLICVIMVAPFLLVVTSSLTSEEYILQNGYSFFIKDFDTTAYKYVGSNIDMILRAYGVTFAFSALSMGLAVLLMSMVAYPLSRSIMPGKSAISFFLYFTMLFSGGLVPSYILNTQYLHLGNTFWIYVLPGLVSPWYTFMIRTNFQGIPTSIIESAYVDGATEYTIFAKFVMPMSKPVLATVALLVFLAKWNDWFTCMLYIDNIDLTALQYLLQRIIQDIELLNRGELTADMLGQEIPGESVRMALAVVVAGPALVVFPFFQKYFTKGMTVGAVKG